MAKKKNINKSRLERMSVEELKSLNKNINQRPKPPESKKPKPPDMFGTCREEKQLLQEISTLPVQEMLSRIENYLETGLYATFYPILPIYTHKQTHELCALCIGINSE